MPQTNVDDFMKALEHPMKNGIEHLRNVIKQCDSRITEEIKWNAPSYKINYHFATFKLYPPKNIQIILHTDAVKKNNPKTFVLDDGFKFIKRAAPDRFIITIKSDKEASAMEDDIRSIINSWIAQLD